MILYTWKAFALKKSVTTVRRLKCVFKRAGDPGATSCYNEETRQVSKKFFGKEKRSKANFAPTWLREADLNHRPLGYEPNELPDCSIPRYLFVLIYYNTISSLCQPFSFIKISLKHDRILSFFLFLCYN